MDIDIDIVTISYDSVFNNINSIESSTQQVDFPLTQSVEKTKNRIIDSMLRYYLKINQHIIDTVNNFALNML